MSKIVIKNAAIIPMTEENKVIEKGDIVIEAGKITYVGPSVAQSAPGPADKVIDAANYLALPGFINCHTHAGMTILRSYADDLPLMQWLSERIWPLEEKLVADDVYWATMLCILEMIKSGTTTFADMYFYMDDVARAVDHTGIRASLSRGMVGTNPNAQMALEQSRELTQNWNGKAGGRIKTMLGPHAPYTCPPDYLEKVMELAAELGVGMHIHVAETRDEITDIAKLYGKSPVKHLDDVGLFKFPVLAAHCVHVNEEDIDILRTKKVGVAHNPESNMKLASGVAPVPRMLAAGIKVGLGTDGAASNNNLDMLEEMRTAALLAKVTAEDPTVIPSWQALRMATAGGAEALAMGGEIGQLKEGYKADIILLNQHKPHLFPRHDLVANVVYAAQSSDIETVIIDGEIVMENRKILTFDEEEVLAKIQEHAVRLVGPKPLK